MGGEEYEESYVFTSVVFMYEKNHWRLSRDSLFSIVHTYRGARFNAENANRFRAISNVMRLYRL